MNLELNKIIHGKCEDVLKEYPDNSVDSCVTDPPYGWKFMNKHWDYDIPPVATFKEIYRILKPGAHILVACGTRTQHRMAVNIEDAGFEIRDVITWHYGSGFPKSLDISKAIDKHLKEERELKTVDKIIPANIFEDEITIKEQVWTSQKQGTKSMFDGGKERPASYPASYPASLYDGYGTSLKPSTEFWTLARKPISESTVAANVLKWGTGGINIDGCRIGETTRTNSSKANTENNRIGAIKGYTKDLESREHDYGRFPSNLILDPFTAQLMDQQSGISKSMGGFPKNLDNKIFPWKGSICATTGGLGDEGGASRYFKIIENEEYDRFIYTAKASQFERNKGLKNFSMSERIRQGLAGEKDNTFSRNGHPTVKPVSLMRYLVKLITPKHGLCLDPFCGSGTTLIGCKLELINYIGIDMEKEWCDIAEARVAAWNPEKYIEQTLF